MGGGAGAPLYSLGVELAVRVIELLEINRDLVFARELIFRKYNYSAKAKEMATLISNEVGRRWGVINRMIEEVQEEPLDKSTSLLRAVLRVGAFEVYYNNKSPAYFAKALMPFLRKKRVGRGFLNRMRYVLFGIKKFRIKPVADFEEWAFWYQFFPHWATKRLVEQFGQERALWLMEQMNKHPSMCIRVNTRLTSCEELAASLREKYAYELEDTGVYPFIRLAKTYPVMRTEEYQQGLFTVQDVNTALGVLRLLDLLPEGATVFDACAAPGRKSSLIRQLRPDIRLFCSDISHMRLKKLVDDFERLRLDVPHLLVADAACSPFRCSFDAVHADLPCSGSGTWGKHPERKWLTTPTRYLECVEIQRTLLPPLIELVKPGGYLLFSTCSLWKEENEDNVKWMTENFPLALVEQKRIYPENATTGFFYALLKKAS